MLSVVESLKDYLINKLISSGIEVYVANSLERAETIFDKVKISILVVDIDNKKVNYFDFIKNLREKKNTEALRIILLTKNIEKDILSKYIPHGLIGFLPKNLDLEIYPRKIVKFIDSHLSQNEKRRNVRITPAENDKISIRLPITGKESDRVEADVIDLSIQGVAFKFRDSDHKNYYHLNQEIRLAEIDIAGRRYISNVKLVRVGDVSVAVYINPKESFVNSIAKFIFDKLEQQILQK